MGKQTLFNQYPLIPKRQLGQPVTDFKEVVNGFNERVKNEIGAHKIETNVSEQKQFYKGE